MKKALTLIFAVCLILTQAGCGPQAAEPVSFGEDWLLNTYCYIKIFESGQESVISDAFALAREYETMLSRTAEGGPIYEFNEGPGGVELSPELFYIVNKALNFSEKSGGRFDISLGRLTELWNFSGESPTVPAEADIAEALSHSGCPEALAIERVETCTDNTCVITNVLTKTDPELKLDLGAIGKGYIADKVAAFLKEKGVSSAVMSLGGNIYCLGSKADGSLWTIGVEDPAGVNGEALETRTQLGLLSVGADSSVVTSGTYERCFTENGVTYHHILDPETGYPVETDLVSASITGRSSADCDALSTICLILGSEDGLKFIEETKGYECVLVKADGTIICSSSASFTPAE